MTLNHIKNKNIPLKSCYGKKGTNHLFRIKLLETADGHMR